MNRLTDILNFYNNKGLFTEMSVSYENSFRKYENTYSRKALVFCSTHYFIVLCLACFILFYKTAISQIGERAVVEGSLRVQLVVHIRTYCYLIFNLHLSPLLVSEPMLISGIKDGVHGVQPT